MGEECREALHELQTYLDGECGKSLDAVIRRHLAECPPCLDRAEFERHVRGIISAKCRDAAPSGLLDRVIAAIRSQ